MMEHAELAPIHPIAAMGGCRGDLTGIVIEKYNLRIVHIQSDEFKTFLKDNSKEDEWEDLYDEIRNEANEHRGSGSDIDHDEWQMLIPIDAKKAIKENIFHHFVLGLIVAFPSDAYLRAVYQFQYVNNELHDGGTSRWEKEYRFYPEKIEQDHFKMDGVTVGELNEFVTRFIDYLSENKELSRAIRFYQSSYQINDDLMSYVALIIVLEVIVPGKEQVFFRLRRSLGILIGRNRAEAERLIKNSEFLYGFRSSVVHGSKINVKEQTYEIYYRYARDIAARLIIEIIAHNFDQVDLLAKEINLSGTADFSKKGGYKNYFEGTEYWEIFYSTALNKTGASLVKQNLDHG